MANSLHRDLKIGDKLILIDGNPYEVAMETFGNMAFTMGSALMVKSAGSDEVLRASGYDIDAKKTMDAFAEVNGWIESKPMQDG